MRKSLFTHALAFFLGLALVSVSAQIGDNTAIYGRMLGAGVATFLVTPSSANFASAVTGETGTGALSIWFQPHHHSDSCSCGWPCLLWGRNSESSCHR